MFLKKCFGILLQYIFMVCYFIYTVLIKWLVAYKFGYRSYIKQVIISCKFCQHFHCLEVVLVSWMILWYLDILGT